MLLPSLAAEVAVWEVDATLRSFGGAARLVRVRFGRTLLTMRFSVRSVSAVGTLSAGSPPPGSQPLLLLRYDCFRPFHPQYVITPSKPSEVAVVRPARFAGVVAAVEMESRSKATNSG
jgi:hypothetical protein